MQMIGSQLTTAMCDKICKYPYISESDEELSAHCDKCVAEQITEETIGSVKKCLAVAYDKMQMQEENHKINPLEYPAPTFEMFIQFLEEAKGEENERSRV